MRWVPVAVLPISAIIWGRTLQSWIWMWVIALALFVSAKWLTISRMWFAKEEVIPRRLLAYAFLWPGMDARAFCRKGIVPPPRFREWALAIAKTISGALLLWVAVPLVGAAHPLAAGWTGMVGLVLLLHFGLFHLVSLFWRSLGIEAKAIMQSPITATSLSKFWGGSWNTAFNDLVQDHLVKLLTRHFGARGALFTIFLISGALHELVISVPARGGYGLPTLYFMLQSFGLLLERSKFGRSIGLGSGWRGWCFVVLVSGAPAFWLFHPRFVHNVILPMFHAIGAT
jgi:alginate O-acetyltransferase complex protein AlgI